jgi:hypothetical protein
MSDSNPRDAHNDSEYDETFEIITYAEYPRGHPFRHAIALREVERAPEHMVDSLPRPIVYQDMVDTADIDRDSNLGDGSNDDGEDVPSPASGGHDSTSETQVEDLEAGVQRLISLFSQLEAQINEDNAPSIYDPPDADLEELLDQIVSLLEAIMDLNNSPSTDYREDDVHSLLHEMTFILETLINDDDSDMSPTSSTEDDGSTNNNYEIADVLSNTDDRDIVDMESDTVHDQTAGDASSSNTNSVLDMRCGSDGTDSVLAMRYSNDGDDASSGGTDSVLDMRYSNDRNDSNIEPINPHDVAIVARAAAVILLAMLSE